MQAMKASLLNTEDLLHELGADYFIRSSSVMLHMKDDLIMLTYKCMIQINIIPYKFVSMSSNQNHHNSPKCDCLLAFELLRRISASFCYFHQTNKQTNKTKLDFYHITQSLM